MRAVVTAIGVSMLMACAPEEAAKVEIHDLVAGSGEAARLHATASVHYIGWLADGLLFDESRPTGQPFTFTIGTGQVIPGWDQGILGMKTGGRRQIVVPPVLGYGAKGAGGVIPPNATLRFEIELLSVTSPLYANISTTQLADRGGNAKLIDIRTPGEWRETGIIAGSTLLTAFDEKGAFIPSFTTKLAEIAAPGEDVVLICRSGNRSASIAQMLTARLGYTRIKNVEMGIKTWIAEKRKVIRPN